MHVLGMPPAFVLSQDQTLKLCHILNQHGDNPADRLGMSFKEPIPALSNVMDTNEHASLRFARGGKTGVAIGFEYPVTEALSSSDRAPSPTCPFIIF